MKKIILISILSIAACFVHAQTSIGRLTTIETVSNYPAGVYRFIDSKGDTVDASVINPPVCPPCPTCPPPIVCPPCPVCPPQKPQRSAIAFSINKVGQVVVTYNDNSTSTFTLTKTIFIQ